MSATPDLIPEEMPQVPPATETDDSSDQPPPEPPELTPVPAAGPFEWHDLPPAEVIRAWRELRDWVEWLRTRYRLELEDRLPPCWPLHPELIEELSALRAWRAEAYSGQSASGQSATYWHQALATFIQTTAATWAAGCRAGHRSIETSSDAAELAARWADANPLVGIPTSYRTPGRTGAVVTVLQIADVDMQVLLSRGQARHLSATLTDFIQHDSAWWVISTSDDGDDQLWLRVIDEEFAAHLDDSAERLAAADAAVAAGPSADPSPTPPPPPAPRPEDALPAGAFPQGFPLARLLPTNPGAGE